MDVTTLRRRLWSMQSALPWVALMAIGTLAEVYGIALAGLLCILAASYFLGYRGWRLSRAARGRTTAIEQGTPLPGVPHFAREIPFAVGYAGVAVLLDALIGLTGVSGSLTPANGFVALGVAILVTGHAGVVNYYTLRIRSITLADSITTAQP